MSDESRVDDGRELSHLRRFNYERGHLLYLSKPMCGRRVYATL